MVVLESMLLYMLGSTSPEVRLEKSEIQLPT